MKNFLKNRIIIITCNFPNKKNLNLFIKKIFKKKLVCCINYINKIKSYFIWKRKIKKIKEIKIIIKTFSKFKNNIIKTINKYHSYKIPEISIIKVNYINKKYFKWMKKNLKINKPR